MVAILEDEMSTYDPTEAKRLILAKEASGEYHVTGSLDLRGCDLTGWRTVPTALCLNTASGRA